MSQYSLFVINKRLFCLIMLDGTYSIRRHCRKNKNKYVFLTMYLSYTHVFLILNLSSWSCVSPLDHASLLMIMHLSSWSCISPLDHGYLLLIMNLSLLLIMHGSFLDHRYLFPPDHAALLIMDISSWLCIFPLNHGSLLLTWISLYSWSWISSWSWVTLYSWSCISRDHGSLSPLDHWSHGHGSPLDQASVLFIMRLSSLS